MVSTIREEHGWPVPSKATRRRTFFLSLERPLGVFLDFERRLRRAEQSSPGGQIPNMVVELRDEMLSLEEDLEGKGVTIMEGDEGAASDLAIHSWTQGGVILVSKGAEHRAASH